MSTVTLRTRLLGSAVLACGLGLAAACGSSDAEPPTQAEVLQGVAASDVVDQLSPEQEVCVAHVLFDELDDAELREIAEGRVPAEVDADSGDQMVRDCGVGADQQPPSTDVTVPVPETTAAP